MRRREVMALLGGAAAWPLVASAEAEKVYRVGVLIGIRPPGDRGPAFGPAWAAFEQGLRDLGYVEGRNFIFEIRGDSQLERLPTLAAELVSMNVDVIVV